MKDVEPLEYISTMWVPNPSDVDVLVIANVVDAFYSTGSITHNQVAVINTFLTAYMNEEITELPNFDEVMEEPSHD